MFNVECLMFDVGVYHFVTSMAWGDVVHQADKWNGDSYK